MHIVYHIAYHTDFKTYKFNVIHLQQEGRTWLNRHFQNPGITKIVLDIFRRRRRPFGLFPILLKSVRLIQIRTSSAPTQSQFWIEQNYFSQFNQIFNGACLISLQWPDAIFSAILTHPIANGVAPPQNQQKAKQFLSPNWFSSTINNSPFFFLYKIDAFKKVATFLLLLWWYGGMQRRIIGDNIIFATYNHCCASIIIVYFR